MKPKYNIGDVIHAKEWTTLLNQGAVGCSNTYQELTGDIIIRVETIIAKDDDKWVYWFTDPTARIYIDEDKVTSFCRNDIWEDV